MTKITYQRTEYPRPQFARKSWLNLNGEWDFAFDDGNEGEARRWFENPDFDLAINVPFTYETKASGIGDETFHPYIWYHRTFMIPEAERGKRVMLRFQASDYLTKVWVNDTFIGEHQGGNIAFSFDITHAINETAENKLVVKVEDSMSCFQPRGKQRWKDESFGCWYVQTTGIWQSVWLEFLDEQHIKHVKMTPNIDTHSITFDYQLAGNVNEQMSVETIISFAGETIRHFTTIPDRPHFRFEVELLS